jgi:hypothetical protein
MEIRISRDFPNDQNHFTVTINNSFTIQTTYAQQEEGHKHQRHTDEFIVKQWVREIKNLYHKKKRLSRPLVVGFSPDHSVHYSNGNYSARKEKTAPFELLQFCIGGHCLLYEPYDERYNARQPVCKALRELLSDNGTILVGVGMENVVEKIGYYGLQISKTEDLRSLAEISKNVGLGFYRKYNLEKLAKVVLGEEWDVEKPTRIDWYNVGEQILSVDKVKYGTLEAFLAYEMGIKLFGIRNQKLEIEDKLD